MFEGEGSGSRSTLPDLGDENTFEKCINQDEDCPVQEPRVKTPIFFSFAAACSGEGSISPQRVKKMVASKEPMVPNLEGSNTDANIFEFEWRQMMSK